MNPDLQNQEEADRWALYWRRFNAQKEPPKEGELVWLVE